MGTKSCSEKRPNIICIFADQLRYDSLGSSGNPIVRTPHLDRLASEGAVFDNAFSSCPLCSPYRGQLLTGRYSHKNGVTQNENKMRTDQTTFPQALKEVGYKTAYIGKWHMGHGPYTEEKRYGFDYMFSYNCNHKTQHHNLTYFENERGPIETKGWSPEVETSKALEFISTHQRTEPNTPFSLHLSFAPPHNSTDQMYSQAAYNHGRYAGFPEAYNLYHPSQIQPNPNVPFPLAEFAKTEIADYYGNITGLDAQVGRILQCLDELGLSDNTIIVFSSDHGDHLRSHGHGVTGDLWLHITKRINKGTPYEESVHIPFILRYPGKVDKELRTEILFNSVDVMPTLLGLCGVDIPDEVQGHDLSHAVTGGDGFEPDSVYLQILGPGWPGRKKGIDIWRGLRTHRWTYARFLHHRDLEHGIWLFDRENDPYELTNLAGLPEYADTEANLEKRLKQWMIDTDDPFDHGKRNPATDVIVGLE